ncbi:hypothetical protein [Nocardia panacis]|uniref:Gp37-like protein n=1 Tax=Nocardia panacis TaxID=2340916 RepID=UPI001EF1054C|nr:hypothetical protein [Nocardia panacis]
MSPQLVLTIADRLIRAPQTFVGGNSMATATIPTIDFDKVFADISSRLDAEMERRLHTPEVRLWDGDLNYRGTVTKTISASFQVLLNETGTGQLEMPLDYYLSKWLIDVQQRKTTGVFVTVDKDGSRWSGALDELLVIKDRDGKRFVRLIFKHDYENLKHVLCWVCSPA